MNTPHVYGLPANEWALERQGRIAASLMWARAADRRATSGMPAIVRRLAGQLRVAIGFRSSRQFVPAVQPDECTFGRHLEHIGTTARLGYVRFVTCRRPGCDFYAIRKGAA